MNLSYRPLVFFWIAEYKDGKALPQFDPETGEENKFSWVERHKLKRFGFVPFSRKLSCTILNKTGIVTIPSDNLSYWVELNDGDELIAKRENIIKLNLKGDVIDRRIVFVLGKVGGKVLRIKEDGSLENAS